MRNFKRTALVMSRPLRRSYEPSWRARRGCMVQRWSLPWNFCLRCKIHRLGLNDICVMKKTSHLSGRAAAHLYPIQTKTLNDPLKYWLAIFISFLKVNSHTSVQLPFRHSSVSVASTVFQSTVCQLVSNSLPLLYLQ